MPKLDHRELLAQVTPAGLGPSDRQLRQHAMRLDDLAITSNTPLHLSTRQLFATLSGTNKSLMTSSPTTSQTITCTSPITATPTAGPTSLQPTTMSPTAPLITVTPNGSVVIGQVESCGCAGVVDNKGDGGKCATYSEHLPSRIPKNYLRDKWFNGVWCWARIDACRDARISVTPHTLNGTHLGRYNGQRGPKIAIVNGVDVTKYGASRLACVSHTSVCTDTLGFEDKHGTCETYEKNKLCTTNGAQGTGWCTEWGNLSANVLASCCACGKRSSAPTSAFALLHKHTTCASKPITLDLCQRNTYFGHEYGNLVCNDQMGWIGKHLIRSTEQCFFLCHSFKQCAYFSFEQTKQKSQNQGTNRTQQRMHDCKLFAAEQGCVKDMHIYNEYLSSRGKMRNIRSYRIIERTNSFPTGFYTNESNPDHLIRCSRFGSSLSCTCGPWLLVKSQCARN